MDTFILVIILLFAFLAYRYSYIENFKENVIIEEVVNYRIPATLYSASTLFKKYRYIPEVHSLMRKYLSNEDYTEKEFKNALLKIREINPNDPDLITFRAL